MYHLAQPRSLYAVLALSAFAMVGCKPLESPIEQVQRTQIVNKTVLNKSKSTENISLAKGQTAIEFICKDDKIVKIQHYRAKQAHKKHQISRNQAIQVTYGNAKHTLSPTVTKQGKRFSNIRWIWQENLDGKSSLSDNSGNVLAYDCVISK